MICLHVCPLYILVPTDFGPRLTLVFRLQHLYGIIFTQSLTDDYRLIFNDVTVLKLWHFLADENSIVEDSVVIILDGHMLLLLSLQILLLFIFLYLSSSGSVTKVSGRY